MATPITKISPDLTDRMFSVCQSSLCRYFGIEAESSNIADTWQTEMVNDAIEECRGQLTLEFA